MPKVPGFLASFADKAQTAINATPLAGHVPNISYGRPSSPDAATQPSANQAAAQGGGKSLALENISYQFRNLQQQYSYFLFLFVMIDRYIECVFQHYDPGSENHHP
jgi:hypothetical protein